MGKSKMAHTAKVRKKSRVENEKHHPKQGLKTRTSSEAMPASHSDETDNKYGYMHSES